MDKSVSLAQRYQIFVLTGEMSVKLLFDALAFFDLSRNSKRARKPQIDELLFRHSAKSSIAQEERLATSPNR